MGTGIIPPASSGSCGLVLDDDLYIFGGFQCLDEPDEFWSTNDLYKLDLITGIWTYPEPSGIKPTPTDKLAGWLYEGKLYYFGGFGHSDRRMEEFPVKFTLLMMEGNYPWSRGW